MELPRRSFRTAAGWFFVRTKPSSSRPTPAKAGGEPGPITTGGDHGSPQRGPRDASVAGCPSRGRPEQVPLGSFRQNARRLPLVPSPLAGEGTMVRPRTRMGEGFVFQQVPLTHSRTRQHRAALSRKGRGHNNADRTRRFLWRHHQQRHALPRSHGALFAPGVCTFASLTRIEGWAERRETFGCSAEHPCGVS